MRYPFNDEYPETQGFGEHPENYAKFLVKNHEGQLVPLAGHNGLDYGLPTGTSVIAPHSGKVLEVSFDPLGYGWYVKIESNSEGSVLAHLEVGMIAVQVGEHVDEGQMVAKSDNTGNSTAPHLHWGYYKLPRDRANGFAGFIDQTVYLNTNTPVDPPISVPTGEMQPMKQIIIDSYRALCGEEPTEDEINYRLTQRINTYDLIREICSGDERFARVWISPKLAEKTDTTTISLIFASLTQFIASLRDKFLSKKNDE